MSLYRRSQSGCRHSRFSRPIGRIALIGALIATLGGCEALFTTNAFANLARDPENMSEAQLVAYSQELISSGNTGEMERAFDALFKKTGGSPSSSASRDALVELGLGATDALGIVKLDVDDIEDLDTSAMTAKKRDIARKTGALMIDAPEGTYGPEKYAAAAVGIALAVVEEEDDLTQASAQDKDAAESLLDAAIAGYNDKGKTQTANMLQDLKDKL